MNGKKMRVLRKIIIAAFVFTLILKVFVCYFPLKYRAEVEKYAAMYGLETELVYAVIHTESHFNENSCSSKGASGLMQIMQPTADWAAEQIGIENYSYERIYEPEINIQIGCWILSKLADVYDNDIVLICAAYNAGMGNVSKWLGDERFSSDGKTLSCIPFEETKNYVAKVTVCSRVYGIINELKFA